MKARLYREFLQSPSDASLRLRGVRYSSGWHSLQAAPWCLSGSLTGKKYHRAECDSP